MNKIEDREDRDLNNYIGKEIKDIDLDSLSNTLFLRTVDHKFITIDISEHRFCDCCSSCSLEVGYAKK